MSYHTLLLCECFVSIKFLFVGICVCVCVCVCGGHCIVLPVFHYHHPTLTRTPDVCVCIETHALQGVV